MIDVEKNYEKFKRLLLSTNRDGVDRLINWLDTSDAKRAPASVSHNLSCEGGLIQHCLDVYSKLSQLIELDKSILIPKESIIIVSLLCNMSHINYTEKYYKNVMTPSGWVKEERYKVREDEDRFIFGSNCENSLFMAESFIPLNKPEKMAILHCMGRMDYSVEQSLGTVYSAFRNSPLAMYLHIANLICTCCEGIDEPNN